MITGKINLLQLKASLKMMKGQSGEMECIVIPIALNNLYKGEKGVYLDLIAFERKTVDSKSGDTHFFKQSLPKDLRDKMTDEEKNAQAIIGNMKITSGNSGEQKVTSSQAVTSEDDGLLF